MKKLGLAFALLMLLSVVACGPATVHQYVGTVQNYEVTFTTVTVHLEPATIDGKLYSCLICSTVDLSFIRDEKSKQIDIGSTVKAECLVEYESEAGPTGMCTLDSVGK